RRRGSARPRAAAGRLCRGGLGRRARRRGVHVRGAARVPVRPAAHLLRDGLLPQWAARVDKRTRVPYTTTLITGIVVALAALIGDAAETYDLTNIGTLFAFVLVCLGVLVLRVKEPDRPR